MLLYVTICYYMLLYDIVLIICIILYYMLLYDVICSYMLLYIIICCSRMFCFIICYTMFFYAVICYYMLKWVHVKVKNRHFSCPPPPVPEHGEAGKKRTGGGRQEWVRYVVFVFACLSLFFPMREA